MPEGSVDQLADEEWLTQHGVRRTDGKLDFRCMLRNLPGKSELDMSMIRGWHDADAAGELRLGSGRRPGRDAARHTLVSRLRAAGFRVEHTPRYPRSPWHVSVYFDDGEWDPEVGKRFHACFDEEGDDG